MPLVIIVIAVAAAIAFLARSVISSYAKPGIVSSDPRIEISGAKASFAINKNLEYPILDAEGEEVTKLKFTIENAELRDEIIVKSRRMTSIKGKTFLIVSLKISNDYTAPMEVKVADYIRLTVNGRESEFLAPEIHSDPVAVQAISTKATRIGFAVNDTDDNISLWVGEIKGNKEKIDISF